MRKNIFYRYFCLFSTVIVNTYRSSSQTRETTLSTLSRETDNTALSSNTSWSGDTRGSLRRKTRCSVSSHIVEEKITVVHFRLLKEHVLQITYRGSIRARRSLLSRKSLGSSTSNLTRATSEASLTTSSSYSLFANGSEGSRGATNSLETCREFRSVNDVGDIQTD